MCMKACKRHSHRVRLPSHCGGSRRKVILVGLALCALLVGTVSAQDAAPPESVKIQGTVVNSLTLEPVGRALVTSGDNRLATSTDSEGRFDFTVPMPSAVNTQPMPLISLSARKPGFLPDRSSLAPGPVAKDNMILLVPQALIIGHVVLPSSEAPDRIQLELYRRQVREGRAHWEMQAQVTSKSNGEFRFADLPEGSYKLLTRELMDRDPLTFGPQGPRFGYPPVYFPGAHNFVSAETIQLSTGRTFQADLTLVKQRYYPVKIAVANSQLAGGMQLIVYPQGHPGPGYSLGAGPNIEGILPSGTYTVEAASGFGANSTAGLTSITVKAAPLEGTSIVLAPTSSVNVNVKEDFTKPEEDNGSVTAISQGRRFDRVGSGRYLNIYLDPADDFGFRQGASPGPPTTPDDKSLVIENIRPGRYWVKINSSRGFVSSATWGDVDLLHQPIVITGASSSPIEVTLRDDWAELDGTVEGPSSSSDQADPRFGRSMSLISYPHVYLIPLPDSGGETREAWAGRDGKFNTPQIPPGVYRVLAFDQPQLDLEYHNSEVMRAYESKGQVLRLVGNQKEQVRLQLITTSE